MTEAQTLSLGQQLKDAREALQLSIEEVAQKTNLKKNHIESLENDIFILQNVPPAFVRGYVRNYVRFLRLPEALVGSVNYGEVTIPNEVKRTAAPIPVNDHKSQTRWLKGLTWLILLCAVGMTLAWWWQEHQKDQANSQEMASSLNRPNSTAETLSQPVVVEPIAQPVEQVKITPESPEPASQAVPVVLPPAEATPVETVTTAPAVEPAVQAVENSAVLANQPTTNTTNSVAVEATEQPNEAVNVLAQATPADAVKAEDNTPAPAEVGNDELRIEITQAQSWITVRGVKNKRLAEKLYNAGEVLTFNGNEQYRLTIGAPANVKIYYKGQVVPLKVDGRVARFKLPLAN